MTSNAQLLRFRSYFRSGAQESAALIDLMSEPARYKPNRALAVAATPASELFVILSGVACRYVNLRNGRRQILDYLLPGDFCDVRACFSPGMGFSLVTLCAVEATRISAADVICVAERWPGIMREFWRRIAVEDATAREWQVNVGRRNALERTAHLLCEVFARSEVTGMAGSNRCYFPISQADMGDSLALSAVHVNRTLQELRRAGLISLNAHQLTLLDRLALQTIAGFEPSYLQIQGARVEESFHGLLAPASNSTRKSHAFSVNGPGQQIQSLHPAQRQ